jgi:hypothetical protein|nr:MAG TPA: hypothetical protein [Caudoviricetes sp.]
MKEVLMLLLAMIIGFAGGAGMFALILHYCNGNEKSVSKKENNVPTEVCAKSFEGMAMAFQTMGENMNKGYTRYIGNSDKMTEQEFKEALKMKIKKGEY